MSYHYGFLVESMVSILLLLTILYCVRLNKQLRLLKADEQTLRATISELITATEIAERAIAGLKATMREGEQSLGAAAATGGDLLRRHRAPARRRRGTAGAAHPHRRRRAAGRRAGRRAPDAKAVAAAAQAFAERARELRGLRRPCRMIRWARDFRLIPVVLLATICLFALKVSGLVFDGGYTLAERLQGLDKNRMQSHDARERARLSQDRRRRRAARRRSGRARQAILGAGDVQFRRRQR